MNYPSVTQVLSVYQDFSQIPEHVLNHAAERGTKVHAACAAHAQGLWVPPLEDEVRGYFESGRNWFDSVVEEVVLVEGELVDKGLGFCGHPDLICRIKGDTAFTVVDYKTPAVKNLIWRAQLAAYKHLVEATRPGQWIVQRVLSLRLSKEGKPPKVDEYLNSPKDFAAFLSALNAYRNFKAA